MSETFHAPSPASEASRFAPNGGTERPESGAQSMPQRTAAPLAGAPANAEQIAIPRGGSFKGLLAFSGEASVLRRAHALPTSSGIISANSRPTSSSASSKASATASDGRRWPAVGAARAGAAESAPNGAPWPDTPAAARAEPAEAPARSCGGMAAPAPRASTKSQPPWIWGV